MKRRKWCLYGVLYFTAVFALVPGMASAYIDPSVTTYAIQAIAGVAVAAGAFFATYGRRMKKSWMRTLDMDENENRTREERLEVTREDLKEKLEARRRNPAEGRTLSGEQGKARKNLKGRIITSLLCGLAAALTVVLRPILSFYLSNESEFWFTLGEVILQTLAFSAAAAGAVFLVHFLLPGRGRINLRLLFAACAAAGCLGVFVQNHFLTSYLPVLTGDPLDWSRYAGWGTASLALWGGLFLVFIGGTIWKPRWFKGIIYGCFALLICMETVAGGVDLLTTPREGGKATAYFSTEHMNESSREGNVVVIVADTFEASFMTEMLEEYPEVREMLPEITFYDNVTGISSLTYFSYPTFLGDMESPMGCDEKQGIAMALREGTLIDRIRNNGWDVAYYSDYDPVPELKDRILNYGDGRVVPTGRATWNLVLHLWKGSLFQSAPHPLKKYFEVSPNAYELIKTQLAHAGGIDCFVAGNDQHVYQAWKDEGSVTAVDGKPRYDLFQLWGVHAPCELEEDFSEVVFDDSVSFQTRRLKAARAMMLLLRTYLDRLKEAGTYDQTTVIMTADHGFDMRYYPVFLVKEAGSTQTEFRTDSTPLSLMEDFGGLMTAVTGGKTFAEAAAALNLPADRTRYALDFRPKVYKGVTNRRTLITIQGPAKDRSSYTFGHDEFLLEEDYPGRCVLGEPFITGGKRTEAVAVYGPDDSGKSLGHTVVFDAFFAAEETRKPALRIRLTANAKSNQRVIFRIGEEILQEETVPSGETAEFRVTLPETSGQRLTFCMDLPDGEQVIVNDETMPWMEFNSVTIEEAALENAE